MSNRRIRSIKPEFFSDGRVARWDDSTRLFYIGLMSCSDDAGRFRAEVATLAVEVWPGDFNRDPMGTLAKVQRCMAAIVADGRVVLYDDAEGTGEKYGAIVSWEKHQRINRPTESRIPAPPDAGVSPHGAEREPSRATHRVLSEPSVSPHGALSEPSLPDMDLDQEVERESARAPARTHTREEATKTADPTGSLADLEALVLECMPPGRRRGALQLSPVVARQLAELVATFGHDAVRRTLEECGEADMPVAMARKRLTRGAQGSTQATHAPTGPIVGPDPRLPAYQPFKPDTKVIPPDMQARGVAMLKQFLADTAGASN